MGKGHKEENDQKTTVCRQDLRKRKKSASERRKGKEEICMDKRAKFSAGDEIKERTTAFRGKGGEEVFIKRGNKEGAFAGAKEARSSARRKMEKKKPRS